MKLYLASFMQKENFGPGRIISIAEGTKPYFVKVEKQFKPFTPSIEMINTYTKEKDTDQEAASAKFIRSYLEQIDREIEKIKEIAKTRGKSVQEILPFQEGDTLASWPRSGFTSHRTILAPILEDLGYEVISN